MVRVRHSPGGGDDRARTTDEPQRRGEWLIQTLHVYLDQQGSMSRTAEPMNMHRNAVSYRIHQIFDLLDVDPENPDDLLLLQLECRARELA